MSKLIEKLEQIAEGRVQPLGFSAAPARAKISPMLLVASVPPGEEAKIALAVEGGAEALLLPLGQLDKRRKSQFHLFPTGAKLPWGVYLEKVTREGM